MITVICPVRNEELFIKNILDFFITAAPSEKELLIVDGMSDDKTVEIVQNYADRYENIRLLSNPEKFVPNALNLAIREAKGDIIIRLDAHTTYDTDYFTSIISCFNRVEADIVGGPMRTVGTKSFQNGVAIATSTIFGIGDSSFHNANHEGYVDSVYLGAWKKKIFDEIGYFDTDMLRNQDDEFHYRANRNGLKIYLDPQIKSFYFPRSNPTSLWKQYYQYGLFKPLVLKKVNTGARIRHFIPAGLVLYLVTAPICYIYSWWMIPAFLYVVLDFLFSFGYGFSKGLITALSMLIIYPILHIAYGTGFLAGVVTLAINGKPRI
jgi:succinoglycan biosynthesis protein ExoA